MSSGYDFCLKSSHGDTLNIAFEAFGWDEFNGKLIYEDTFYLSGVVNTQGYVGHFNGYSSLPELKQFISLLKTGLKQQQGKGSLNIYLNEGALYGFPSSNNMDIITIEIVSPYKYRISGKFNTHRDYTVEEDEDESATIGFQYYSAIEPLQESLWDLQTIYQILEELHMSNKQPPPTLLQNLRTRARLIVGHWRWLMRIRS